MHQPAKIRASAAEVTKRGSIANYNLQIAAALLAIGIVLIIGVQLAFLAGNVGVLNPATDLDGSSIVGP
jgi:hypothetical protein